MNLLVLRWMDVYPCFINGPGYWVCLTMSTFNPALFPEASTTEVKHMWHVCLRRRQKICCCSSFKCTDCTCAWLFVEHRSHHVGHDWMHILPPTLLRKGSFVQVHSQTLWQWRYSYAHSWYVSKRLKKSETNFCWPSTFRVFLAHICCEYAIVTLG